MSMGANNKTARKAAGNRRDMEHRAGIEPANTGFADQRVSHFATGALCSAGRLPGGGIKLSYFGWAVVRR